MYTHAALKFYDISSLYLLDYVRRNLCHELLDERGAEGGCAAAHRLHGREVTSLHHRVRRQKAGEKDRIF